jgi:integrase
VITANQAPDHPTIARFRVRHEGALAGLFGQVLGSAPRRGWSGPASSPPSFEPRRRTRRSAPTRRLPPRCSPRRPASMPPRTRSTARLAATSCPRTSPLAAAGGPGCGRRRSAWSASAPPRGSRSRELDRLEALLCAVRDDAKGPTERCLLLTAAMAGLRQRELLGLCRRDVDWPAARIRVRQSFVRVCELGVRPLGEPGLRGLQLVDRKGPRTAGQ